MKKLVCIGDSLTEGLDIPVGHSWPVLVANALDLEVINCGIGGDTTGGMLARYYQAVLLNKPDIVFIMGGTNDLWWGFQVNVILGNLFSMVVQARHHGIAPAIGLPMPVNTAAAKAADFSPPLDGFERFTEKMEALLEGLIFHATESDISIIDLHRPFLTTKKRIRTDRFLADGLHPDKTGHQLIADEMAAVFRRDFNFS
ncbi:MAG: GDSL-type esterase/lipase family protein [Desulfosarcina sp.]|jgi:lysophospholipase L1-like esterase